MSEIVRIEAPPSCEGSEGLIAVIVREVQKSEEGTKFYTQLEDPLQIGVLNHPEGWISPPHRHFVSSREIKSGSEVLVILEGSVLVTFFDSAFQEIDRKILRTGDILYQWAGGHSFKGLEKFRAVEIKQGPYFSADKIFKDRSH